MAQTARASQRSSFPRAVFLARANPEDAERGESQAGDSEEERGLVFALHGEALVEPVGAGLHVREDIRRPGDRLPEAALVAELPARLEVRAGHGPEGQPEGRRAAGARDHHPGAPAGPPERDELEGDGHEPEAEDDRVVPDRRGLDPEDGEQESQEARPLRLEKPHQRVDRQRDPEGQLHLELLVVIHAVGREREHHGGDEGRPVMPRDGPGHGVHRPARERPEEHQGHVVGEDRVAGQREERTGDHGRHEERLGERQRVADRIEGVAVEEQLGPAHEIAERGQHHPREEAGIDVVGKEARGIAGEGPGVDGDQRDEQRVDAQVGARLQTASATSVARTAQETSRNPGRR